MPIADSCIAAISIARSPPQRGKSRGADRVRTMPMLLLLARYGFVPVAGALTWRSTNFSVETVYSPCWAWYRLHEDVGRKSSASIDARFLSFKQIIARIGAVDRFIPPPGRKAAKAVNQLGRQHSAVHRRHRSHALQQRDRSLQTVREDCAHMELPHGRARSGGVPAGGRRCRVACSYPYTMLINVGSLHARPKT